MTEYTKNFSSNLRNIRKKRNMTQKQLAELLGYSEKTVSKWERGACVPDIDVLFGIAKVFQMSIENLFSDKKIYFLGIDGGGTKTTLALADFDGNIIRTHKTGSCNPMDIGLDEAKKILKDGIYKICDDIPLSSVYAFAGIAGGTVADMKEKLEEFFRGFGVRSFIYDSDNRSISAAGLGKNDGMTVILGTGICVNTQVNKKHKRTAGWGYLIDNGGSGYNLGRDALNAYFCAFDKTGQETLLTDEIDKIYPGGVQKILGYIYEGGKKAIAAFAPAVFLALEKGDKVAENILERNTEEVARFIKTAAKDFDSRQIPVVLAGGLTKHSHIIDYIKKALHNDEQFDIKILDRDPVCGAVMLARQLVDIKEEEL